MRFGNPSWRPRINAAFALAVAAVGAAVAAFLSYRATDIVGARFDRPLSDGRARVFMYETPSHWYANHHLWIAVGFALATASVLARRSQRRCG